VVGRVLRRNIAAELEVLTSISTPTNARSFLTPLTIALVDGRETGSLGCISEGHLRCLTRRKPRLKCSRIL